MRNTLPLLSRPQATNASSSSPTISSPPQAVPSIRLISATPSAAGTSADFTLPTSPTSPLSAIAPWAAQSPSTSTSTIAPSPLAPRLDSHVPRKRLVPKKSKLGLLGTAVGNSANPLTHKPKDKSGSKDFSDVVRRLGAPAASTSTAKGAFEIYVDHNGEDENVEEVVVVKKKKSRLGLDGLKWGSLGEVTNVPATSKEEKAKEKDKYRSTENLKVKGDDSQRWWSIGRSRKDSKEKGKEKENKEQLAPSRATSPEPLRKRFNSIGSSIALSSSKREGKGTVSSMNTLLSVPKPGDEDEERSTSPAPAAEPSNTNASGSGSIALRAMRSMRSLARMKSWATLTGTVHANHEKEVGESTNTHTKATTSHGRTKTRTKEKKEKEREKEERAREKEEREKEREERKKRKQEREARREERRERKEREKEEKEKVKREEKERRERTVRRSSGSSFEAGAPSIQATPTVIPRIHKEDVEKTAKKKQSILGLGLPSTISLSGTVRKLSNASSSSSVGPTETARRSSNASKRLSADSAHMVLDSQGRPSSIISTRSSLRPPSTASGHSERSERSSSGSAVSIRWDEAGIRQCKERQRQERRSRREAGRPADPSNGMTKRGTKESRKASEARRRVPISQIFPGAMGETVESAPVPPEPVFSRPVVTVEEATTDGHSDADSKGKQAEKEKLSLAKTESKNDVTPMKKPRARPWSDQILGKARPVGMYNEGDAGVISILDAATNDLASLINRLDLEATPASSTGSPFRPSPLNFSGSPSRIRLPKDDSPIKKRSSSPRAATLRENISSISSLRPYAKAQAESQPQPEQADPPTIRQKKPTKPAELVGQNIAPWSALDWQVSPKRPASKSTLRPKQKRAVSPPPAVDPPAVFQPLRPARSTIAPVFSKAEASPNQSNASGSIRGGEASYRTFGGSVRSAKTEDEDEDRAGSPTPMLKRLSKHTKTGSLASAFSRRASKFSLRSVFSTQGGTITKDAKRGLGLGGTMGSSTEPSVDPEDPDSDIPDELQVILAGQSDDETTTLSGRPPSRPISRVISPPPVDIPLPPTPPTPGLRLLDDLDLGAPLFSRLSTMISDEGSQGDVDEVGNGSEDENDTKKSFDFTGELQKLNQSGASDRRSFVEQLENAFRTPTRISLGLDTVFLPVDAPPVPPLRFEREPPAQDVVPRSVSYQDISTFEAATTEEETHDDSFNVSHSSDTLDQLLGQCDDDVCRPYPAMKKSNPSMRSKASDGRLNTSFRFGGTPPVPVPALPQTQQAQPIPTITFSDIIPPSTQSRTPSLASSDEEDESAVLKSILAHATELQRQRVDSQTSSKLPVYDIRASSYYIPDSRRTSVASFTGFESFDEVRRGFEFHPNRPAFYPPPVSTRFNYKRGSAYSVASVSSYGATLDSGKLDPFGYGPSRPTSEDMSTSLSATVEDTFAFMKQQQQQRRKRVDSDASSFYFRPGRPSSFIADPSQRRRRPDSMLSIISGAPPVSLYNRRRDSANSAAQSYAMFGAPNGGRAIYARHNRQNPSLGSIASDYSAMRGLARPGLGDKMFEMDHGMPLSSITASPTESSMGSSRQSQPSYNYNRTTFDSIIDGDRGTYGPDSLFDRTDYRSSVYSSDGSVFGFDASDPGQCRGFGPVRGSFLAQQYRPLSILSTTSVHSAFRDDDTMFSMLGGGHVRRRSVDSGVDGSPCLRIGMERKKNLKEIGRVLKFDEAIKEAKESPAKTPAKDTPEKPRLLEKPSIASTSSAQQFGGERMIKARKGLLERQSLEESTFATQGEDLLASLRSQTVFSRPEPVGRSRSSTVTSSSGGETPPLSCSESISGGSQSSIDLVHLNSMLSTFTRPSGGIATARARARGTGHRRRISQARASRSSVYETIQEESTVFSSSPSPIRLPTPPPVVPRNDSPSLNQAVYVVDSDTQSITSMTEDYNDEHGIVGLRRYYALQDEARLTVEESKQAWVDTPFSIFALQSFDPPKNRHAMKAMLEHSRENYGPLASELHPCRVRSRTSSRASPYPVRSHKPWSSLEQPNALNDEISYESFNVSKPFASPARRTTSAPLKEITVNPNIKNVISPTLEKPFKSFSVKLDDPIVLEKSTTAFPAQERQRVTSGARRAALGWKKRGTGKSSDGKENMSHASITNPSDSLRLSRPRPRGRQASARAPPIRV